MQREKPTEGIAKPRQSGQNNTYRIMLWTATALLAIILILLLIGKTEAPEEYVPQEPVPIEENQAQANSTGNGDWLPFIAVIAVLFIALRSFFYMPRFFEIAIFIGIATFIASQVVRVPTNTLNTTLTNATSAINSMTDATSRIISTISNTTMILLIGIIGISLFWVAQTAWRSKK